VTISAAVFMTVSIVFVVGLMAWCYAKVLTGPSED
jgi:hypothetical protein